MLTFELLRYAAEAMPLQGSPRVVDALAKAREQELAWVMRAGLGPMLYRATRRDGGRIPTPLRTTLLASDLTAQVRHECKIGTARRVADVCRTVQAPVILLKGISISAQCYPAAHLRPMSDIDVLVPVDALAPIETALRKCGFFQDPRKVSAGCQHGEPLFDPEAKVWVELHRALFPARSSLSEGRLFSTDAIADRCVMATTFEDRTVFRLSNELQLIYIASYWRRDLSMNPIDPGLVMPLIDAVCLLTSAQDQFDWAHLLSLLDNPMAMASLLLLLTYLSSHGVVMVPSSVLDRLAAAQMIVNRLEIGILGAMVHRYLVGGRPFRPFNSWHIWKNLVHPGSAASKALRLPWNILFPPTYPQRYSMMFQQQRIARWLGRP